MKGLSRCLIAWFSSCVLRVEKLFAVVIIQNYKCIGYIYYLNSQICDFRIIKPGDLNPIKIGARKIRMREYGVHVYTLGVSDPVLRV